MRSEGNRINFDKVDRLLLKQLQEDCTLSVSELAEQIHLTGPACWKRIQRLKAAKVITGQVMLCDPRKLDRGTTVFVFIQAKEHNERWLSGFSAALGQLPEVVGAYRLSGDIDYLLQVLVRDIAAYDDFYQRLIRLVNLSNVSSSFAMERIKFSTAIPVDESVDG